MKKIPFLDLSSQYSSIKDEIDAAIFSVIHDSAFVGGKYVEDFEKKFALFAHRKHAIGVANGTSALFLSLKALGIGEKDTVVVPSMTFVATAEAVSWCGAKVCFADVREDDLLIDTGKITLKDGVKAVIPVDLYGKMVAPEEILKIAEDKNLHVVWDCCQSHGAQILGEGKISGAGSFGDSACFSFYPGKNLGAYGDGGAVVTDSQDLSDAVRLFSNHGREGKYEHAVEGFNERLDGLQAAVLEVKLKYLDSWNDKRRKAAEIYRERLAPKGLWMQKVKDSDSPSFHLLVIQHSKRDELSDFLGLRGIGTGKHYPSAIHLLKAYSGLGYKKGDFPVSEKAAERVLSLPVYPQIKEEQIHFVCDSVEEFIAEKGL
ncbi:DegT/DnrJ/EryC1/StrS family aminotransferase [candidate division WOR-3 bacterium]|nr:DegT/DnrJ/EryC1/StrS family aminotransferase [candidate division WOR-3 bacterium]